MAPNLFPLVPVGALALVLIACSSPVPPSAQAPAADTPKPGGRLNLDVAFDIANLDTTLSTRREVYYTTQSFNRLTRFKSGPDVKYSELIIEPELAERWEVSPDARAITFTLRKGVKFANLPPVNGRDLVSSDVKFTYEYVSRAGEFADKKLPASLNNWVLEGLDRIDTPDPSTVTVRFKEPFVPALAYSSLGFLSIIPREIYDQDGNFREKRVGTGPYQFDRNASQSGSRLVWKKNPDYWETGKPYLDEVYQIVLADEATARAALTTKQLDMMTERVNLTTVEEVKKLVPNIVVGEFVNPGPAYMWMNTKAGTPTSNEKLRQAIDRGIDREELIRTLTDGKGSIPVPGAFPDTWSPEEVKQLVRYDQNEAKRLVTEAGHANGIDLEFIYPGRSFGDRYITAMELVQAQLRRVGINLVFKSVNDQEASLRRRSGDFVMSAGGTVGLFADPDSYMTSQFHPNSTNNHGQVNEPALTAMIEAQRRETDPAKRREIVRNASRYIQEHALGYLTLYLDPGVQLWQPYVKGYYPHFANPGTTYAPGMTTLWLDK